MEGQERIDVVCDIFSAGVLFHVLLTNTYLFTGANSSQIYEKNKNFSFDLEDKKYDDIDPKGMELLKLMLEIDC